MPQSFSAEIRTILRGDGELNNCFSGLIAVYSWFRFTHLGTKCVNWYCMNKNNDGRSPVYEHSLKVAVAREYLTSSMGYSVLSKKYGLML